MNLPCSFPGERIDGGSVFLMITVPLSPPSSLRAPYTSSTGLTTRTVVREPTCFSQPATLARLARKTAACASIAAPSSYSSSSGDEPTTAHESYRSASIFVRCGSSRSSRSRCCGGQSRWRSPAGTSSSGPNSLSSGCVHTTDAMLRSNGGS